MALTNVTVATQTTKAFNCKHYSQSDDCHEDCEAVEAERLPAPTCSHWLLSVGTDDLQNP